MFYHQYPTEACAVGNDGVRSLRDNVASLFMSDNQNVSGGCDCQHQGGWEIGLNGTVNISESLINVVSCSKPKMLTGLNQKVSG
jgi:hypothetical protein